jgi:aminoglycoside 3-N-acetyltransferase
VLTFRDFITGFRKLDIDRSRPIIAHASLSAFGDVHGGAGTVLGGLLSSFDTLIMPTFTYKTMITPELGPPDNAMNYGSGKDTNRMAEIYRQDMPADTMMGEVAESLRTHLKAIRSTHPILSFAGINAKQILDSQSTQEPLLPIQTLIDQEGWVLLMGVDQTVNTSIHYAEQLTRRKQFIRWALTPRGVSPCHRFPGCSDGFEDITPHLDEVIRSVQLGEAVIQAIPMVNLIDTVCRMLKEDPLALLCGREDCERCNAVRVFVSQQKAISSNDPDWLPDHADHVQS